MIFTEIITESFGEIIVTCLLVVRFQWLLDKDYKSFGFNFQTYIILTMSVSFLTMLHTVHKYHTRYRRALRPIANISTALLIFSWALLIFTKLTVYVVSFINTPGLFFEPIMIKTSVLVTIFEHFDEDFPSRASHDKFIYILISNLIPISLPDKSFKTMKNLLIINFFLYFLECSGIIFYAVMMNDFYHNELYHNFNQELSKLMFKIAAPYDFLLLYVFMLVFGVTLFSSFVLYLNSKFLHPRKTTFG